MSETKLKTSQKYFDEITFSCFIAVSSISYISNASKYKIDANLLLLGNNVAEFYHQSILLIDIPGEVPARPYRSDYVIPRFNLYHKQFKSLYLK